MPYRHQLCPVAQVRSGRSVHEGLQLVQGVVKSYDPATKDGVLMSDTDFSEYDLSPTALNGSIFRMLRQGQRVIFDLDSTGLATHLRLGSEVDMGTPDFMQ